MISALLALACIEPDYILPDSDSASGSDSFAASPVCPEPHALAWVEVGESWGLVPGPEDLVDHMDGGGLALGDLDGDGDEDLVVSWERGVTLHRRGQDFSDLEVLSTELGGAPVLADLDGDGGLELMLADDGLAMREASGAWSTHFERSGTHRLRGPAVADLDGDGWLDLYLARTSPDRGNHDLVDDTVAWGSPSGPSEDKDAVPSDRRWGQAFQAILVDSDGRDGAEVYVDNDMGGTVLPNALLTGEGQSLKDLTEDCGCGLAHSGMGGVAADLNGDGLEDLYLAGTDANVLLQADGFGGYFEVTANRDANPIETGSMAWGVAAGDLNNDGRMDLVSSRGDLWAAAHPGDVFSAPIAVLLLDEAGTFEDHTAAFGMDAEASWRTILLEDLNDDGVLDLIVSEVLGRPYLYLSQGCTEQSWIEVEAPPNSRVELRAGEQSWVAWTRTQSGYAGSRPSRVHLGLGQVEVLDSITVQPPWGEASELSGPIPARQRLRLPE